MDLLYIWSFTYVWSAYGVLHLLLYCTCISPFLSPFLFYSWVRLFFYDSMAVYVIVVCMYVSVWLRCGVVWCGVGLLSLFYPDRRGDGGSMARQQSSLRGAVRRC